MKKQDDFLLGQLSALQFIVIWHDQPTIAGDAMVESGYKEKDWLKAQKLTGHETRKMNQCIRDAFKKVKK